MTSLHSQLPRRISAASSSRTTGPMRVRIRLVTLLLVSLSSWTSCDAWTLPPPASTPAHRSSCRMTPNLLIQSTAAKAGLYSSRSSDDWNDKIAHASSSAKDDPVITTTSIDERTSSSSDPTQQQQQPQQQQPWFLKQLLKKLPPLRVDDTNLLLYDVALLINLVVSIDFWVLHRMDVTHIPLAFNEGCLLCLCWIAAGLYHGAFLHSAVDGHFIDWGSLWNNNKEMTGKESNSNDSESSNNTGGPTAAGMLAVNTFINTVSLRLIVALVVAVVQHRAVGAVEAEQLVPLEVGCGLVLMSAWRSLHSYVTPRI